MEHLIVLLHFIILIIGITSVILLWIGNTLWRMQLLQPMRFYWVFFSFLYAKNLVDSYFTVVSDVGLPMLPVILSIFGLILKLGIITISINIFILPLLRKKELFMGIKFFIPMGITFLLVIVALIFQNPDIELYRVMHKMMDYIMIFFLLIQSIIFTIFYIKDKSSFPKLQFLASLFILIFSTVGLLSLFHDQGFLNGGIFFDQFMIFPLYYLGWSLVCIIWFFKENRNSKGNSTISEVSENWQQQYSITAREKEIITLLIKGKNRSEIAEDLFISPRTVDNHTANIYRKCSVKNKIELLQKVTSPLPK